MVVTQEMVDAAWREWQAEESRDRNYDPELVYRLKQEYLKLKAFHQADRK